MISVAVALRSSRGFRLIWMRPLLMRGVGAVDADERGQARDVRVLQNDLGQLLLALGHGGEGDGLRRLGDARGSTPVSCTGKKPLGTTT